MPGQSVTVWRVGNVEVKNRFEALSEEDEMEEVEINLIEKARKKQRTITLDSGAGASCLPKTWMPDVPLKPKKKGVRFVAAEGSDMGYYGRKDVRFKALRSEDGKTRRGSLAQMEFHVTNSNKALAAAMDVVDAGNTIILKKGKGQSVIINDRTGERIYIRRENGTFVFDIELEDELESSSGDMEVDDGADKKGRAGGRSFGRQE